ncbi:MAG: hypothetical protein HKN65_10285 [Woeseiaceae bacterium]|nr:hypothetical protein [Woeseiaceae bacterium]
MLRKLGPFFLVLLVSQGTVLAQDYVPAELEEWTQWVLKDTGYRSCPLYFNRGAAERADFQCAWPGQLRLDVDASGANFRQEWTVYGETQWITLPGNAAHWPDRVTVNDRPVEVVARNNVPAIRLSPGAARVAGRFVWGERPSVLRIPPESGLLILRVDGRDIQRPDMDRNGVFLGERQRTTRTVDAVRSQVYRLVVDEVPTRLVTRLRIDVSGGVREESFGPVLPEGFVPLSLQSRLPARLEADGILRLQVRPGRWEVLLGARGPDVLNEIASLDGGDNLPAAEIWSYQSNDRLRITAAEGLPPVDPAQVEVPGEWLAFPAFRVEPGAVFSLIERSRGVVAASNELALARTMWLDFARGGFIVRDEISGQMRSGWRLDMGGEYRLLSASEDGESLLITDGDEEGHTGIEVRRTDVSLQTLGRVGTRSTMPATGWDARFANVGATLNLPPGSKLLTARGVDRAQGSWTDQWQLLNFFLVLIITIAAWRLFNPTAGIIALLALVLSYHELFAPTWVWLNLLVAVALLRVAPPGRLYTIVRTYQLVSAAALVVALVPFIASQVRIAIYPQLEPQVPVYAFDRADIASYAVDEMRQREIAAIREGEMAVSREAPASLVDKARPREEIATTAGRVSRSDFSRYAPNAIVQAGPGIPSWRWNSYRLSWSGPVDAAQEMRLMVLPRWLVSTLRLVGVGLMLLFAGIIAAEIAKRRWTLPGGFMAGRAGTTAAAFLGAGMLLISTPADAQFPDAELLEQLEERLLEPPDCVPRCAEIAAARVDVGPDSVELQLTVHALQQVAIPLPGSAQGWRPDAVVVSGQGSARVLRAGNGTLWLHVSPGRRSVTLRGGVPDSDSLEIPFPAPPRVITVASDGWMVAGVRDRRLLSGSLQLSRLQSAGGEDAGRWESSRFPPFAHVSRRVDLDLDWRVATTVQRVAPLEGAVTLEIPLLEGETIVSGDFSVEDGRVLVTMEPQQREVTWTSNLPAQSPLTLRAPEGSAWKESWRVAVGNIWHATFEGIPESNTGYRANDVRIAEFDPRAGERLVIATTRPEASAGSTLAFDAVDLDVVTGARSSDVTMSLAYRSTRGAQHVIVLPPGAELTSVRIDGRPSTLRAEDRELSLPILPGEHKVSVAWRASGETGFSTETPEVDLGAPASNIDIAMSLPEDRWLLGTRGPQLGPAVLYWTELAVLVLFAIILGRIGLAPLGTGQWLILGLGFSTFNWGALALVVIWLLACGARDKIDAGGLRREWFNAGQVTIAALTVFALLAIVSVLPQGLLGTPDMHVTGHMSHGSMLGWFADRSESLLPRAAAFTLPMWIYKVIILAWALWLSFSLVRWLPWVWKCFSSDGFWKPKAVGGPSAPVGGPSGPNDKEKVVSE